jgi:hypothetical protein
MPSAVLNNYPQHKSHGENVAGCDVDPPVDIAVAFLQLSRASRRNAYAVHMHKQFAPNFCQLWFTPNFLKQHQE